MMYGMVSKLVCGNITGKITGNIIKWIVLYMNDDNNNSDKLYNSVYIELINRILLYTIIVY